MNLVSFIDIESNLGVVVADSHLKHTSSQCWQIFFFLTLTWQQVIMHFNKGNKNILKTVLKYFYQASTQSPATMKEVEVFTPKTYFTNSLQNKSIRLHVDPFVSCNLFYLVLSLFGIRLYTFLLSKCFLIYIIRQDLQCLVYMQQTDAKFSTPCQKWDDV